MCVDAHCADNNRAETVLDQFTKCGDTYGLPFWVRSDHVMENFGVTQNMLERRGLNTGSIITGSSVHSSK